MALARILTLARIACGLAGAVALAGVDPLHSTDVTFLAAAGVADRPPMASAIAATARVAPDAIFVFMLIISS
jgi:hypothetical protein